jgi:hypothetical protein
MASAIVASKVNDFISFRSLFAESEVIQQLSSLLKGLFSIHVENKKVEFFSFF